MSEESQPKRRVLVEPWEMVLLRDIGRRFRTHDEDELEAELARKLIVLKTNRPRDVLDWRAYLAKFFYNKATNWIRDERARDSRKVELPEETSDCDDLFAKMRAVGPSVHTADLRPALAAAWSALEPDLRALWLILLQENGNRKRAAQRLNKHRNTIRAWATKIRQVLIVHGLQPFLGVSNRDNRIAGETVRRSISRKNHKGNAFTRIPGQVLDILRSSHSSGTQWQVVLWVILHTAYRKQRTIPLRWSEMARALSLNRSSTFRAGHTLVSIRALTVENERIGLHGRVTSSSRNRQTTSPDNRSR